MQYRDDTYDLMKGTALLLMMLCHLVYSEGPIRQFIYSFHMPLFFIVGGVFARNNKEISTFKQYTIKNAKRLLLPYLVTMSMLCLWGVWEAYTRHNIRYFLVRCLALVTASGDPWCTEWGIIYAGPMWFLIALFWVRELFYIIQHICMRLSRYQAECMLGLSLILSMIAVQIHPLLPALPFCILQALTALPFYFIGWYINHNKKKASCGVSALCVIAWPLAIAYGNIDIADCAMKNYLLSFLGACGGTYVIYNCYKKIVILSSSRHWISVIYYPLLWCGIYSLPILCMHDLELYSGFMNDVTSLMSIGYNISCVGVGVAVLMAYVLIKIPILKNIYSPYST